MELSGVFYVSDWLDDLFSRYTSTLRRGFRDEAHERCEYAGYDTAIIRTGESAGEHDIEQKTDMLRHRVKYLSDRPLDFFKP